MSQRKNGYMNGSTIQYMERTKRASNSLFRHLVTIIILSTTCFLVSCGHHNRNNSFILPLSAWYAGCTLDTEQNIYAKADSCHTSVNIYTPEDLTIVCDKGYEIQAIEFSSEEMSKGVLSKKGREITV